MERLIIFLLVLMTFTGVSLGKIGKAMLTPFHVCMGLVIAYVTLFARKGKYNLQISLLLLVGYIVLINALNFPNTRVTSVLYTVIFSLEYLIISQMMLRVETKTILKAFEWIIYLYAINVFIGFCFTLIGYDPGHGIINVHFSETGEGGRPMGFSSEPSYAAFIISIVFLSFNHLRGHVVDSKLFRLAGGYLAAIVFMKSAYGFLFVAINLFDWFLITYRRLNFNYRVVFITLGMGFLLATPIILTQSNSETILRLREVAGVLSDRTLETKDKLKKLQAVDGSAYARIGPTYLLTNARNEIDVNLITGAGAGAAGDFLARFLTGILVDAGTEKVDTGIIPAFVFDYGIIGSILLIVFFWACAYNLSFPFWICIILILPNCNINTQLFWFAMTIYAYTSLRKV